MVLHREAFLRIFLGNTLSHGEHLCVSPGGHPNSPSDGHFKFPQLSA